MGEYHQSGHAVWDIKCHVVWLLKLGVRVVGSMRGLVLHLPASTPEASAWRQIALRLGARAG